MYVDNMTIIVNFGMLQSCFRVRVAKKFGLRTLLHAVDSTWSSRPLKICWNWQVS